MSARYTPLLYLILTSYFQLLVQVKIAALNLPVLHGDNVHCLDILYALVKRIIDEVEIPSEMKKVAEDKLLKQFPKRKQWRAETTTLVLRQQMRAALVIQASAVKFRTSFDLPITRLACMHYWYVGDFVTCFLILKCISPCFVVLFEGPMISPPFKVLSRS